MTWRGAIPEPIRARYAVKLGVVVLVIVAAVVLTGLFTFQQVSDRVEAEQLATMETNAELEAQTFGEWIEGQKDSIRVLSTHRGIDVTDSEQTRETLRGELEALPDEADALHVVERTPGEFSEGNTETILTSTNSELEGEPMSVTNIRWNPNVGFNFDSVDQSIQSWVYLDGEEPEVALASPVPGTEYALVAVYRTNVRAEQFASSIEGTETIVLGGTTADVLFDQNKSNVLTEYKGDKENTTVGKRILETDPAADLSGSVLTDESVIAYHRVPGDSDWVVVKEAPRENALAVQGAVQDRLVFLIGTVLLGFFAIGVMVHRGPMRSLSELTEQATAIAKGDLSEEIESTERIDEIGRVRSAFGEMKAYINTVTLQAEAIAERDFEADVLEEDVPGRLGDSMDAMRRDIEQFVEDLESAREKAERSREEAEQLVDELESQAEQFGAVVERAAGGDLTARLDTDIDNEAMYEIASGVNEMLADIESTMAEIQAFSHEVAAASEEASASAGEAKRASEQISKSVQEIASGADDQREQLEQISSEMNNLSATIEEVASTAQTVANTAQETEDVASSGEQTAQQAIDGMEDVQETMTATVENVESLDELMTEIDEIVELIADIAEQTNMLALNANIEAARAGGDGADGEGFAVVADEVKQLAGETQDSAEDVAQLVEDVQEQTTMTVEEIQAAERQVRETTDAVEETANAFADVVSNIETTNDGVQEISEAMDDQAASSEEVVAMADGVAEISQTTAAESENVSASAEEQASSMAEVTSNVESLADQADKLQDRLEDFEVDAAVNQSSR